MNGSYRERAADTSVHALVLASNETLAGREPTVFESEAFSVSTTADREGALERIDEADCVVVSGDAVDDPLETIDAVLTASPTVPTLVVGGDEETDLAARSLAAGVTEYLQGETLRSRPDLLETRVRHATASSGGESRPARRGSRSWAEFYGSLYQVSSDTELTFEEKLERLLSFGAEYLGVELGFLSRIEDDVQTIVVAVGDHELLQGGSQCPLSKTYCRKAIETDGLLGVHDALESGWEDDPAYEAFDLGCYIGGRVTVDGELYGTLCFADIDPQTEPFTDPERTAVELLTRWASYELEERRTRERLRRKTERLERLTGVVSHDLRNPLSVAQLQLGLVRDAVEPAVDDGVDLSGFEHVADAHDRMETIIDDLLWLAQEGRDVGELEAVSLEAVAHDAWRTVDTGEATLEVTDCTIRADPNRLRQVLENLFRNAVEHGSTSPASETQQDAVEHGSTSRRSRADSGVDLEPTIRVGPIDDGTVSGFYVEDDGPGVPAELGDAVFEPGTTSVEHGTGLGLSIVEGISTAHDWTVSLAESDAGGARFEFVDVEAE